MKILFLTDQFHLHGGVEKVLSQKLNYLAENHNHKVYLVTIENKNNTFCYNTSDKVCHSDLAINYYRSKSFFNFFNLLKLPIHINSLNKKIREIKPDVIVSCNYSFDFYFLPYISNGIKIIKEYHSSRYFYVKNLPNLNYFKKIIEKINNLIEKKYDYLVILNKDEEKYFNSKNTLVIPNPTLDFGYSNYDNRQNIIIAAGRIAPVKQFDHLIKIWSLISNRYNNWELHIYGEGDKDLQFELQKLINTLKIPNIFFKGATDDLYLKMKNASIFALTSQTECFPMVLLESLSCGLPVISYDCPNGPRNIITNNEDGILINHNNIESFAEELEYMINNFELRKEMSTNAKINIRRFDEIKVMQNWIELFNK